MFFQYINQVMTQGVDLNQTISKCVDGDLTVLVMPRVNGNGDPARNMLIPLNLKGKPQEIDAGFFPAIQKPIQETSGILKNMDAYARQQAEAEKNSKAAKESKDKETKEKKEKKDKYDAAMKKADEAEKAGKLEEAVTLLKAAKLHATDKTTKTVDDKIAAIRVNLSQKSLFEVASETQPTVVVQPVQQQVTQPETVQQIQAAPQMQQPQASVQQVVQTVQQPMQQPAPQQGGMQPNLEFGVFSGRPQQQAVHSAAAAMGAPSFISIQNVDAHREDEYANIVDYPQGMGAPIFDTRPSAGA